MIRVQKDSDLHENSSQKPDLPQIMEIEKEKSQQPSTSKTEKLKKKPKALSKGIYKKGDTIHGFKITSEGKVYAKHVTYDINAIKDVAFKRAKLRLR